jgi:hypothetical protein
MKKYTILFKQIKAFSIFVKTQNTPNPHFLKFKPGKELLEEGETYEFNNPKQALISPLARKLFDVRIFINRSTVSQKSSMGRIMYQ